VKLKAYEQIRIVFNRRHDRYGIYRFFLPKPGNHCDHNGTRSRQTDSDAIAVAAPQNNRRHYTQKCAENRRLGN
jgi:hypothetical protein